MRIVCLLALLITTLSSGTAADLRILPSQIQLQGPGARHRVLVEEFDGDIAVGQAATVQLETADPDIAVVEDGVVVPRANGTTELRAMVDGEQQAAISIAVSGIDHAAAWTFRNHIEPVLTRLGCNSGACHGALAGKGGFRLSLRGYDPDMDYFNITQQQLGRRIDPASPGHSLVLTKPTAAVAHKGGKRMDTDSLNYEIVSEWIADGAPGPQQDDATLVSLTILPEKVILTSAAQQPLLVQARYSDGTVTDVTHWAKFNASNEAVARVDENGVASVIGPGEGAVTALFGSQVVIARITVPFQQTVDPQRYEQAKVRNFIDELALQQLQQLNLEPSGRCSDETFVRRAFLDTIGVLPTAEEVRTFLSSTEDNKRDQLIEQLLDRPELDLSVVGGADDQRRSAETGAGEGLLQLDSRARRTEHSLGRHGPGTGHLQRIQSGKRGNQLLRPAPEAGRHGRERQPGISGTVDRLCPLSQPSARKMDERSVLRVCQSVFTSPREGLGRRFTQRRRETDSGACVEWRIGAAANRKAPAAHPAGRNTTGIRRRTGSP